MSRASATAMPITLPAPPLPPLLAPPVSFFFVAAHGALVVPGTGVCDIVGDIDSAIDPLYDSLKVSTLSSPPPACACKLASIGERRRTGLLVARARAATNSLQF